MIINHRINWVEIHSDKVRVANCPKPKPNQKKKIKLKENWMKKNRKKMNESVRNWRLKLEKIQPKNGSKLGHKLGSSRSILITDIDS